MAVAVKNQTDTRARDPQAHLALASLLGVAYVVAALAAVFSGLPYLWQKGVTPWLEPAAGSFLNVALRAAVQLGAAVLLAVLGRALAGPHPPEGLRGGVFVALLTLLVALFLTTWVAGLVQRNVALGPQAGYAVLGAIAAGALFLAWRFLRSARARRWMLDLEHGGWFTAAPYKRSQGLRVRRMTMLGVLLITGSGVFVLMNSHWLATAPTDWRVSVPFTGLTGPEGILLLPDVRITLPLLLMGLSLWFAYRLVNMPTFADFLIATEAELNKVSWTPRKRLVKDTVVVLTTVFLLTLFLLAVDLFWGWILSREIVGIIPGSSFTQPAQAQKADEKIEW
ncbi:MAG TPA: preprotein translocase subunit SecE [Gemmataceae bacterium]